MPTCGDGETRLELRLLRIGTRDMLRTTIILAALCGSYLLMADIVGLLWPDAPADAVPEWLLYPVLAAPAVVAYRLIARGDKRLNTSTQPPK